MTSTARPSRRVLVLFALLVGVTTMVGGNPVYAATGNTMAAPAADDETEETETDDGTEGAEGGTDEAESETFGGELSADGDSFGPAGEPDPGPATPAGGGSEPPLCIEEDVHWISVPFELDEERGYPVPNPDLPRVEGAPEGDTHTEQGEAVNNAWEESGQEPPVLWYQVMCRDPDIDCTSQDDCVYDEAGGPVTWRLPGEDGAPATTQADLINALYADLQGLVETPVVSTNPGPDQASIVNVPTFFTVDNWEGPFDADPECAPEDPDFCVWATVTPRLSLDPGEPDAPTVACEGPGQPYDRYATNGDPFIQADWPATCTYAYTKRTGTDDRGDYWTATLTIVWDIEWFPDDAEGTPTLEAEGEIDREVHEVHAVVTD